MVQVEMAEVLIPVFPEVLEAAQLVMPVTEVLEHLVLPDPPVVQVVVVVLVVVLLLISLVEVPVVEVVLAYSDKELMELVEI